MFRFIECRHILPTGRKCHSPALRGKSYCYYHAKLHFRKWGSREPRMLKTLALDDPRGLQAAVAEALTALRSPLTDPKKIAVILYGLNLANNLSRQTESQPGVAGQSKHATPDSPQKGSGTRQTSGHNSIGKRQGTTSVLQKIPRALTGKNG